MSDINLVSSLHDPNGIYVPFIAENAPKIQQHYAAWCVISTPATSAETLILLDQHNILHRPEGGPDIGESRRRAVRFGLEVGHPTHIQYCDFDRMLQWQMFHSAELTQTVKRLKTIKGFVSLGRTDRAFNSHPRVQISAETVTNRLFTHIFDPTLTITHDVTAGSSAMSVAAAEVILKHSAEPTNGTDCEWPMIVNRLTALPVEFWQTEGLEFETATFAGDDVFERSEHADNWHARIELALASIEAAIKIDKVTE